MSPSKLALKCDEDYVGFIDQGGDKIIYAFWSTSDLVLINVSLDRDDANNTWRRLRSDGYKKIDYSAFLKHVRNQERNKFNKGP